MCRGWWPPPHTMPRDRPAGRASPRSTTSMQQRCAGGWRIRAATLQLDLRRRSRLARRAALWHGRHLGRQPGEIAQVLLLAIGLAGVLISGAFLYGGYRRIECGYEEVRENAIDFELQAAPGSDRHVETLLARCRTSPSVPNQYVANAAEGNDQPEALRRIDMYVAPEQLGWLTHINVLRRAGRELEAEDLLRQAIRRMPRDSDLLIAWAQEPAQRQDWTEAARRFARLLRHDPGHPDGGDAGSSALIEAGQLTAAEALLAAAWQRVPT